MIVECSYDIIDCRYVNFCNLKIETMFCLKNCAQVHCLVPTYPHFYQLQEDVYWERVNSLLHNSAFWHLWNTTYVFESIMENQAFAPLEQMLYFP